MARASFAVLFGVLDAARLEQTLEQLDAVLAGRAWNAAVERVLDGFHLHVHVALVAVKAEPLARAGQDVLFLAPLLVAAAATASERLLVSPGSGVSLQ